MFSYRSLRWSYPQTFDFNALNEGALVDSPQYSRKRTHSISEGFQDSYSRPSWSGQDRGTYDHPELAQYVTLTGEEFPPPQNGTSTNIDRRTSFGEMTMAGNLITGSNEGILKA